MTRGPVSALLGAAIFFVGAEARAQDEEPPPPPPPPHVAGTLVDTDICPIVTLGSGPPFAICWSVEAAPAGAGWHHSEEDPRFDLATLGTQGQAPAMTIIGLTGRCITRATERAFVRVAPASASSSTSTSTSTSPATPAASASTRVLQGFVARGPSCANIGAPVVVLGGTHPDARFLVPPQGGSVTGARDARHFLRAHGARPIPNAGPLLSASQTSTDVGRYHFEMLQMEQGRPEPNAPPTSLFLQMIRNQQPYAVFRNVVSLDGFLVDVARLFAIFTVRGSTPTTNERHVVELEANHAELRSVTCERAPATFTGADCGVVMTPNARQDWYETSVSAQ